MSSVFTLWTWKATTSSSQGLALSRSPSNRVGTRKPSTHLLRFSTCKVSFCQATDIARSFRPNTLSVRWAPARQCGMRFLLELLGTVHEKCGNCRGRSGSLSEIVQIVTSAVCVFVAVHCSVAKDDDFSGLMRLRSSSCSTSSIVTNRGRDSSVESVRLKI